MILKSKESEFSSLFAEFAKSYLHTPEGEAHLNFYDGGRAQGRANFDAIKASNASGEDITDRVLRCLLPHTNSTAHRASGAWVHIAPTIQGDIKEWFEGAGWTKAGDWPKVAQAIFNLVASCTNDADNLETACAGFSGPPYTKGLQTGQLTPILNAINPDAFLIINNKSRKVVNYFTGQNFKQPLPNYPATNKAALALVHDRSQTMRGLSGGEGRSSDLFDIFCHWLVAVKKYEPIVGASVGKKIKTEDSEVIVSVPDNSDEKAPGPADPSEPRQSYRIQAALARIGVRLGFRVWVPRSDRQSILALISADMRGHFLDERPLNYDDVTLKTIEQIDVIWMKHRAMARAFEVEHTTAIYSGLLRMADLLALQPNMDIRLHIAAPLDRRDKVRQEILRPTFSLLERGALYKKCTYLAYSAVDEMNALPHLEQMKDSIVEKYEEVFAEDDI